MVFDVQPVSEYYRFCPDQVEVKIADAICIGRRRANYPHCRGCRFNDDRGSGSPAGGPEGLSEREAHLKMIGKVFKAYDVRATYPDPLNESVAWRVGHATALFFRQAAPAVDRANTGRMALVIGRDMRKSSPDLAQALIEGVRATGTAVIDIGMIDTSQLYFAVAHFDAIGGIQTTASHNPAHYNGFKICGRKGAPIGATTGLVDIQRLAENIAKHQTGQEGTLTASDLATEYKDFIRRFLKPTKPLKVVVDASNGMAGPWVPTIFGDVPGLELDCLNMETTGEFVHEPNPLVDANLDQLRDRVRTTGADFGVCFDGDADRCMLVDENADIVRCDMLTALLARYFLKSYPRATIVYDLRSSRVVKEEITAAGGVPRRERVGHAFMKKTLAETDAVFGGELSGHFYFKDNFYCDSGMLALVHVLNVLTELDQPLSQLISPLKRFYSSGERNFETDDKDGTIAMLAEVYHDAEVDDLDGITVQYDAWWFNVRKSNTEPLLRLNLEAETPELLAEKLDEVAHRLGTPVAH
jgi:phosphomannomutase